MWIIDSVICHLVKWGSLTCVQLFVTLRKWQPTPGLLPGESHGWRSLVGYSPWGRKESDTTERLTYTVWCQVPLSKGFSRQEYWSGLLCPPPRDLTGNLPDPGMESRSALQADSLPIWATREAPVTPSQDLYQIATLMLVDSEQDQVFGANELTGLRKESPKTSKWVPSGKTSHTISCVPWEKIITISYWVLSRK